MSVYRRHHPARLIGHAALGLALLVATPMPAAAFETEATIKAKLNVAGRQRMLTQRIAAKACFLHEGIAAAASRDALEGAYAAFETARRGLRHGDRAMGLLPEGTRAVQYFLDKVDAAWTPYAEAVYPVANGAAVTDGQLVTIATRNGAVLERMHKAVGRMERTYAKEAAVGGQARAINFAGAQRMLSQRIAKAFCLIAAGVEPDTHRFGLQQDLALFDKRQRQLAEGDETGGVPAPATAEIAERLAASTAARAALEPLVAPVTAGAVPDEAALAAMAEGADTLLERAHAAVLAMETAR